MLDSRKVLMGMTAADLREVVAAVGMPRFAAGQIEQWLYKRFVGSIDEMSNISKDNRAKLSAAYTVGCMPYTERLESQDGTVKYLFPTVSGKSVEAVFIPENDRATLCVSSQVGCKMNCLFCQTGKQGFEGNLTAGDILNQIYSLPERDRLTNIVFMGQGEPTDNLQNVLTATQIMTAEGGFAWSPKRITISSVGTKSLKRLLDESQCHIAISLHAAQHELRAALMPIENSTRIADVVELLRQYDFSHQRRLSFEYIVFAGENDTLEHAKKIIQLTRGLHCRVNLIRFHHIPDTHLRGASEETMLRMRDYLTAHGVFTTIRASRGQDIFAACGLLNTAHKQCNENTKTA